MGPEFISNSFNILKNFQKFFQFLKLKKFSISAIEKAAAAALPSHSRPTAVTWGRIACWGRGLTLRHAGRDGGAGRRRLLVSDVTGLTVLTAPSVCLCVCVCLRMSLVPPGPLMPIRGALLWPPSAKQRQPLGSVLKPRLMKSSGMMGKKMLY